MPAEPTEIIQMSQSQTCLLCPTRSFPQKPKQRHLPTVPLSLCRTAASVFPGGPSRCRVLPKKLECNKTVKPSPVSLPALTIPYFRYYGGNSHICLNVTATRMAIPEGSLCNEQPAGVVRPPLASRWDSLCATVCAPEPLGGIQSRVVSHLDWREKRRWRRREGTQKGNGGTGATQ